MNDLIRNKLVLRNHFLWPICHLLHKDKELLALRNNFRATKKFLIAKFDCINNLLELLQNMVTLRFRNDTKLVLSGSNHYMVVEGGGVRPEIGVLGGGWKRCDSRMCNLLVPHRYHHWWMKHHFFSMQPISWAKSVGWCPTDTMGSKKIWFWFDFLKKFLH